MKISLAMIVRDEENYIERCLNSVQNLVDEIIVVDTGSVDNTISIVKSFPNTKLYQYNWRENFADARNFSIEQASNEYILVLDADEYLVNGSKEDLYETMNGNFIGRLLIESRFMNGDQEEQSTTYVSRFFPKDVRYQGSIHEQLISDRPRVNLTWKVKHDGYLNKNKSERNIPLLIKEVADHPSDPYYLYQLGKELRIDGQYRGAFKFLSKSYELVRKSVPYYADLVVEIITAGKELGETEVLQVIRDNEESLKNLSDFHFAKGLFFMEYSFKYPRYINDYMENIELSFLECLRGNLREIVKGTSTFLPAYNLGVFYEVIGKLEKAQYYYTLSSKYNYKLAMKRMDILNINKNKGKNT